MQSPDTLWSADDIKRMAQELNVLIFAVWVAFNAARSECDGGAEALDISFF